MEEEGTDPPKGGLVWGRMGVLGLPSKGAYKQGPRRQLPDRTREQRFAQHGAHLRADRSWLLKSAY